MGLWCLRRVLAGFFLPVSRAMAAIMAMMMIMIVGQSHQSVPAVVWKVCMLVSAAERYFWYVFADAEYVMMNASVFLIR